MRLLIEGKCNEILALLGRDSSDALIAGLILGVTDAHFSTALLTTPSHILWCSDPLRQINLTDFITVERLLCFKSLAR
jgi:hypothetical protein